MIAGQEAANEFDKSRLFMLAHKHRVSPDIIFRQGIHNLLIFEYLAKQ